MTIGTNTGKVYESEFDMIVDTNPQLNLDSGETDMANYVNRRFYTMEPPKTKIPLGDVNKSLKDTIEYQRDIEHEVPPTVPGQPIQDPQGMNRDVRISDASPDPVHINQQYAQAKEDPNNPLTTYEKGFLGVVKWMEDSGMETGTNIRLFNDVIQRGRTEPITNKDFQPDELDYLKGLVLHKAEKSGKKEGVIDYPDYGDYNLTTVERERTLNMGKPSGILKTSLGGFKYKIEDDGSITVDDKYDFNMSKGDVEGDKSLFNKIIGTVFGGTITGGIIGRKLIPDTSGRGIPVQIKIPGKAEKANPDTVASAEDAEKQHVFRATDLILQKHKLNDKAWEDWLNNLPESKNVDDRRDESDAAKILRDMGAPDSVIEKYKTKQP